MGTVWKKVARPKSKPRPRMRLATLEAGYLNRDKNVKSYFSISYPVDIFPLDILRCILIDYAGCREVGGLLGTDGSPP